MTVQGDLFTQTCGELHPTLGSPCHATAEHTGSHITTQRGSTVSWTPTALAATPLNATARKTDPASSQRAARYDFGVRGSYKGLAADILACARVDWRTCRELIECIFGPGPYTYDEAVSLNKVQTVALELWRRGELERCDDCDAFIVYRRKGRIVA